MSGADLLLDRAVHVTVYGLSDAGRRRAENQDAFLIADLGAPPDDGPWRVSTDAGAAPAPACFAVGPRGVLAVVADGMGGAAAGAVASRLAVAEIYGAMTRWWTAEGEPGPDRFARRLRQAVERANAAIHAHAARDPACHGMGTTVTACGIVDGCLLLAQVGDSRAYLVRGGRIAQLTRDQSLVQSLMDAGTLSADQAERSGYASVLLQALGPAARVEVDLTRQQVRRGDLLLLCSDGLFRTMSAAAIAARAERTGDPAELCRELVEAANDRGGPDNVTVVAARLDGPGLEPPRGDEPMGRHPYDPAR
ncbi:MAG TPA: protein phosphatase 2C domain-containing protein [Longimicrobiaceae bacterium]|nr:protein phosphatase 2C domain-containing protein [Longimicrobiaceae bacterium]